jgi:hypothetical protein
LGEHDFRTALAARHDAVLPLSAHRRAAHAFGQVVALGMILTACRKEPPPEDRSSSAASPSTTVAASPAVIVANPKHDFGHVTQGETLRHAFMMHNAGSAALSVDDTLEVLGCRAVPVPKVLEPGANGKLEVTCRASVPAPLRVSLPLRANGRPAGELSMRADVEPLLVFDRGVVELKLPFGEERSDEVRLRGKFATEARLTLAAPPPPGLEATVLSGDTAKSQGVTVRARGKSVGTHVGSLRFATGLADPREVSLSYIVKVTGTLTVSPTNPVLELGVPGPKRVLVKVTSTQPGFVVTRAEVLDGPFSTSIRRGNDGYDVEIVAVDTKLVPGQHGMSGRVRIHSNDKTETVKDIPVLAIGTPFGGR